MRFGPLARPPTGPSTHVETLTRLGGRGDVYFYNADTDESMVEHPLEVQYRQMYTEAKLGAGGRLQSGGSEFDPNEAVPISHQEVQPQQLPPPARVAPRGRGRAWWSQTPPPPVPRPALWLDVEPSLEGRR
jgi:hypothetical protein